jgi:selenocysteine lyase/cysteine desulfurase
MQRRDFIARSVAALAAVPVLSASSPALSAAPAVGAVLDPSDWVSVRNQFELRRDRIHMASFLLSSHPRPVAEAIEKHRRGLDFDPAGYWGERLQTAEPRVQAAAAEYLQTEPGWIALTDSTTMGLGLIYSTIQVRSDQEILTTTHDHYATIKSLQLRAERTGASVREVALYDHGGRATVDEILTHMREAISDKTRVFAVTWVHSSTGVKLPIAEMSAELAEINADRDVEDRVLFCVDGVHGLGIEDVTFDGLGCDFFIAGTHKWLFGPRGTGIICGRPDAWEAVEPVIPSFGPSVAVWIGFLPPDTDLITHGSYHTPGGFHSFENRWALDEAFHFHKAIGKARIERRIHALNSRAKEALAEMAHVELHTPMDDDLSCGIICFEVEGHSPGEVTEHLAAKGIISSPSPYPVSYARIAPSLINNEEEIDRTVAAIAELAA